MASYSTQMRNSATAGEALNGFRNPGLVLIVVTTIWDMIQVFRALDSVVEKVIASPILNPDK